MNTAFYAAHLEGHFATAEAALAHAKLSPADIALAVANAQIEESPGIFWPKDEIYGALVVNAGKQFALYRAFYGWRGSIQHAKEVIDTFRRQGINDKWAIFELTRRASTATAH